MRKKLTILAIILVIVAAVLAGLGTFYTDYLWFEHLGFDSVFIKVFLAQVGIGAVFGAVAFLLLMLHIVLIRKYSKPRKEWTIPTAGGDVIDVKQIVSKVSTPVVIAAAVIVAVVMGYWASRHWEETLRFLNRTPFGSSEPILGQDIGFYLFVLPTMQFVQEWLVYLTGLCLVMSAVVYFLRGSVVVKGRFLEMPLNVQGHLLFAVASILLVLAWGWRIEMFETLFSKRGVAYGATYTDVYVNLVVYRVMIAACVVCALYLFYLMYSKPRGKKATKQPGYALAGVVGLYLLGSFVAPTMVQQFVVNPNELDKEKIYLDHAIKGTRAAYGLDQIEVKEFPANNNLTIKDIEQSSATIDNIKIWDHRPLRSTYKQVQVIRLYYDFPSISVDRYTAADRYWQVMLSARELVVGQLEDQAQTWVNQHLQYTHGYGVCLSPVKLVVGEGLPDLWIKDIPPESRYPHMRIHRPEIYYGQATTEYVLVKTTTKEFDYPKGRENVYTTYGGEGGVGIGSFFRRLLFTIRMADINILFTGYLTDESRILYNRTIQERVTAVAPFLMYDQEAYMTVVGGRLYWIQDAYTVSYRYPYSQPTPLGRGKRINYIRNSVKVVVDAYNGKMTFYIFDDKDPMVRTYAKMFPDLFKPGSEMPAKMRAHVRYPKDLFQIQAATYESFHMTDPQVWYNQEDKWRVSRELGEKTLGRQQEQTGGPKGAVTAKQVTQSERMAPYYMIMKLPGEPKEEFLLMVPYTPANKDNMVAWMTARCDGDNYGKLLVYTFPKKKLIFGPMQIEARIDQDDHISQWITLRNQQGSTVIRGDLLVIPIRESILYVEPIYLEATQTQLPELKQVIVSFGKRLTMKPDLRSALYKVFGVKDDKVAAKKPPDRTKAPTPAPPDVPVQAGVEGARQLVQKARAHYEAGQEKVAKGDWAGYGAEQARLRRVLDQLANKLEGKLRPKSAPPKSAPPKKAPAPAPKEVPVKDLPNPFK
jgi:uncharacterized membrane protein (UPF0182 family)